MKISFSVATSDNCEILQFLFNAKYLNNHCHIYTKIILITYYSNQGRCE